MQQDTVFCLSRHTLAVIARLSRLAVGEVAPWGDLSDALGMDAQREGRHHVDSARRVLLHQERRVYDVVREVGVKHLTPHDLAHVGGGYAARIHRAARRGQRKARTLTPDGWDSLTREEQTAYQLGLALLSSVVEGTRPRAVEEERRKIVASPPPRPDFGTFVRS